MTNFLPELADAKCIFIIGSNTTENHPIAAKWIFRGREKGAKIIVVDPRATQMAFLADIAVQHRLGTDIALINGLMHIILKEGWHDKAYVEERTEGFEALAAKLEDYPPDKVAQITGVDAQRRKRVEANHSPGGALHKNQSRGHMLLEFVQGALPKVPVQGVHAAAEVRFDVTLL